MSLRTIVMGVLLCAAGVARADYASVDGVKMYYEVHGSGPPLVLLHGGGSNIEHAWSKLIPRLSRSHRVIAIEQMGQGRTPDLPSRPFSYERMADETATLLAKLAVGPADFVGHSDGGNIALMIAMHHPERVHKVVVSGANYRPDGLRPEVIEWVKHIKPEEFAQDLRDSYARLSPDGAAHWPVLMRRICALWLGFTPWPRAELAKIKAPTMIVVGDDDAVRVEHAVDMFRAIPGARLYVLPGTGHSTFKQRTDWIVPVIEEFFAEPIKP